MIITKPPKPARPKGADGYPAAPPALVPMAHLGEFIHARRLTVVRSYWAGTEFIVEVAPGAAPAPAISEEIDQP